MSLLASGIDINIVIVQLNLCPGFSFHMSIISALRSQTLYYVWILSIMLSTFIVYIVGANLSIS